MTIHYFPDLVQGSDEWFTARCGLLTASEMHLIVSPPPEPETRIKKNGEPYKQREWYPVADNDKCRAHLYELMSQRITRYVEPGYIGHDMLRGQVDEIAARELYASRYAEVQTMGFVTNDEWGFTLGCSPDGLVGDDGMIEVKSRRQKYQVRAIADLAVDSEHAIQVQTALLVTRRAWNDYISYCGGLPMLTLRVYPDPIVQNAIIEAAGDFEARLAEKMESFAVNLKSGVRLIPTERTPIEQEMFV